MTFGDGNFTTFTEKLPQITENFKYVVMMLITGRLTRLRPQKTRARPDQAVLPPGQHVPRSQGCEAQEHGESRQYTLHRAKRFRPYLKTRPKPDMA